jgi:hypothetical protein
MRIYSLFLIIGLFSCSAKYHYRKAVKKGLEELKTADTIRISTIDSVPVIKHDTIVYERFFSSKDTIIQYQNIFVPKTRLETRIEYKLKRDTIRMITRVEVQKAKASKKPNYFWMLIALVFLGFALFVAVKYANKKI